MHLKPLLLVLLVCLSSFICDDIYFGNDLYVLNKYYKEIYQKYDKSKVINIDYLQHSDSYNWLLKDAVRVFVRLFREREKRRVQVPDKVTAFKRDRRSGSPFLSDDVYRTHCAPHICYEYDDGNYQNGKNCFIDVTLLSNGSCIYVPAVMLDIFLKQNMHRIKVPVVLVSDRLLDQSGKEIYQ